MLVLSRKAHETIVIGANIKLYVLSIKGRKVQLGIEAPSEIAIRRAELARRAVPCSLMKEMDGGSKRSA